MMTQQQKKMKRYCTSIEWRLNLPRDVKARVMNDFTTTIAAMREAGKSDEEIYAELGSSKKVAADLNEQMKEFAYRKSPWRFAFLGVAVVSGLKLAYELVLQMIGVYLLHRAAGMTMPEMTSIGVIGGADGPTAIFVTAPDWIFTAWTVALLVIGLVGYWWLKHRKPKNG